MKNKFIKFISEFKYIRFYKMLILKFMSLLKNFFKFLFINLSNLSYMLFNRVKAYCILTNKFLSNLSQLYKNDFLFKNSSSKFKKKILSKIKYDEISETFLNIFLFLMKNQK